MGEIKSRQSVDPWLRKSTANAAENKGGMKVKGWHLLRCRLVSARLVLLRSREAHSIAQGRLAQTAL